MLNGEELKDNNCIQVDGLTFNQIEDYLLINDKKNTKDISSRKSRYLRGLEECKHIGSHVINGDVVDYNSSGTARLINGPFELEHHEHSNQKFGIEGKYYVLRQAKKHITRRI